jgi:uncharacterized protein (TIGR00297 family)
MWLHPKDKVFLMVMLSSSFASATADTLSSELGNIYGNKFYNMFTLKADTRGLDGVISLEGTLLGLVGSIIIAIIHLIFYGSGLNAGIIIIAGTLGNFADSFLGATLQKNGYLNNDAVNFLNTLCASFFSYLFYRFL